MIRNSHINASVSNVNKYNEKVLQLIKSYREYFDDDYFVNNDNIE